MTKRNKMQLQQKKKQKKSKRKTKRKTKIFEKFESENILLM